MKRITLLFYFFTITLLVQSQSYIGFLNDNYSGVNSVISNPANIVETPYKLDINLVGASAFVSNDYYGVNVFNAIKAGYNFDIESKKHLMNTNSGGFNVDALGPSFMFNLSENSSLALFTRARVFANVNEVDGESIASIDDDTTNDVSINEQNINALAHSWAEFGISYARVLLNKSHHVIKGGVSLKYLQGQGSAFIIGEDITIDIDDDGTDLGGGRTVGSIDSSGNLTYARYDEFDNDDYDYKTPDNANGIGVDFGFVYEYRQSSTDDNTEDTNQVMFKVNNNYKLKIGVSLTDIGFIDYKDGIREAFNITDTDVNQNQFEAAADFGTALNTFYTQTNSVTGYIIDLPTTLHVNVDWSLNGKMYLNLNTDFSLMSKDRISANRVSNLVSLTPRFESKWFSFYLPLSAIENNGIRMGAGFRAGPLYIGSGSVISAFASDNNREADAYAGLKIGLFKDTEKDKDEDGVIDELDDCPEVFGFADNNGCPWGDKDGDSILDNIDLCPEKPGPEDNKGCPWGDKDDDGIIDKLDACPEEPGSAVNKGCPWKDTDGDGVLDKDDDCIDAVGTAANNGCPEAVIQKLQTTLNTYAKVIFFNSGTSSIKDESNKVLSDIIAVLKDYPNAKFTIEGHTDSIGSYGLNKRLSDARANAVKNFLVINGIDSNRLTAIGYGERKPIATNMYKAGRKQNRRVEIKLVK